MAAARRRALGLLDVALRRSLQFFVRAVPPRHKGMTAVTYVNRVFPPSSRLMSTTFAGGIRITCDLRDSVQSSVFYRGVHEGPITALLLGELRPGDVFCDFGANIGYFTLLGSRAVGPEGHVHAFEPSRELCARLRADIERNGFTNVTVHEVAVSDRTMTAALVLPLGAVSPYGQQYLADEPPPSASSTMVSVVAVDEALPDLRFDVAKIDIEGSDLRALAGMRRTVEKCRPRLILVEEEGLLLEHFGDSVGGITTFLGGLGYACRTVGDRYDATMLEFRPKEGPGAPGLQP